MFAESIFPVFFHWNKDLQTKKKKKDFDKKVENSQTSARCEDRTHDLQISNLGYETDGLPSALTRHLQEARINISIWAKTARLPLP